MSVKLKEEAGPRVKPGVSTPDGSKRPNWPFATNLPFLIADNSFRRHTQAMPPSTTVISDPPANLKAYEVDLIERVREHGWQTTSVGADDSGDPAFSYTTGFWLSVDYPEVIVFDFPPQLSHDVFGQMISKAREGHRLLLRQPIEGILSNEKVCLFPVRQEAGVSYLRSSDWFYRRNEFPAVQLVWADGARRFPWERDFDGALVRLQPDLSERGWAKELDDPRDGSFPSG